MVRVVFEDKFLLVLDKPPGLVVTSSQTQKRETLEDILKSQFNLNLERGGIVHRLDKDTSGLIIVAKTPEVLENLQAQFKERTVKKEYLALVHGFLEEKGKMEGHISRNPKNREKFMVVQPHQRLSTAMMGREAMTEYEPIKKFKIQNSKFKIIFEDFNKIQMRKLEKQKYGEFTLLACKPKTGRTHQIRVHLKYIGYPVVGDNKYAGRKMARLDRRWVPRQFLHACKLEFNHPSSRERLIIKSNLPKDLKDACSLLNVIL